MGHGVDACEDVGYANRSRCSSARHRKAREARVSRGTDGEAVLAGAMKLCPGGSGQVMLTRGWHVPPALAEATALAAPSRPFSMRWSQQPAGPEHPQEVGPHPASDELVRKIGCPGTMLGAACPGTANCELSAPATRGGHGIVGLVPIDPEKATSQVPVDPAQLHRSRRW